MNDYRIDTHKLHLHPVRVGDWLKGDLVAPIYAEISLTGRCNHRCTFCAMDFMGYQPRSLKPSTVITILSDAGSMGLKSVMFGGEGEPLLHKGFVDFTDHAASIGIDTALVTNGVLLRPEISERILATMKWIKVSCNAGTAETYASIHNTASSDFTTVLNNLECAANYRSRTGDDCTLGMQILLLPENAGEIETLAGLARDAGLDYLVVKPYSQHLFSKTHRYEDIHYDAFEGLSERLEAYQSHSFSIIYRNETMKSWDHGKRGYERCYALNFWTYVDAGANLWACSSYLGDERFNYGNLEKFGFRDIWLGEKRRTLLKWVEEDMDAGTCRINCRMDKINQYLWELKHPKNHVNFI
jgi:GTP 3',8-cyclase